MINNLFSMFDPSSSFFSISWIIIIVPLTIINNSNNFVESNFNNANSTLYSQFSAEIKQLLENPNNITSELLVNIFLIIATINFLAIFPFNFTPTAHISISFSISMSIWLSTICFGWVNQFNHIISHLTPLGTPENLINFMVLIETVSAIIRPITLSVRLSANIVAGHLLISLLSSFSLLNQKLVSFIPIIMLTSLEFMVAIVQAYVITTLLMLYQNETNS